LQFIQHFPKINSQSAIRADCVNLEKEMSEDHKIIEQRRRFLKLVGGGAVLMPIMGLSACSGGEDKAPAAATPKADAKPAMDAPKVTEDAAPTKPSGMPQISEDDVQAKSLNYVHDAASIDGAKQPRFKAGQACSNCALYQGKAGDEWAGCSIFPGKAVKGTGWCSVYAPKSS
jgi:hypothetical protein